MLGRCCRGVATLCLAMGLCLPALGAEMPTAREFTPSEHLMHSVIAGYFGLTHQQVMDLASRGYSYEEIATAANIAARSGRPLAEVVAMRDQHMEWPAIATHYSVTEVDIYRPTATMETRVAGARTEMGGTAMGAHADYAMPSAVTNWSRTYELTPIEMKRLRAKGLSDKEITVVANAATLTGRPVDTFVDMIFRGATVDLIAKEYNLNPDSLTQANPLWGTPEWEQAVKEGRWSMPPSSMMNKK